VSNPNPPIPADASPRRLRRRRGLIAAVAVAALVLTPLVASVTLRGADNEVAADTTLAVSELIAAAPSTTTTTAPPPDPAVDFEGWYASLDAEGRANWAAIDEYARYEALAQYEAEQARIAEQARQAELARQAEQARIAEQARQAAQAAANPPAAVAGGSVWDDLAWCESNGNWAMNSGNGFYGGIQFMHSTWVNMGGRQWAEYPHQASRDQQIEVATRLQAQYGWGQWPACSAKLGLR
jgi:hypothetical protein